MAAVAATVFRPSLRLSLRATNNNSRSSSSSSSSNWLPRRFLLTLVVSILVVAVSNDLRGVDGQAQRIALYSGPDGKGQAVLLTDSCEDLGDRSKPGCTGIPAGTSFDNKAQSARIDGFWVLYNDKRFGPADPIHYIVGMDKTVNLGRSSSKASSVRRVGSLTNWKKDEHLSLFQFKNFAGNEVVMNPYQPTFFGHEGIPAQSAVAINSEWTVVTEHQNFCLRAKGGAYVVMDFRKEFDLSLEMILHIRHGCMLSTGSKNSSSHGGFSVVSPTLSPLGGQQQQQQLGSPGQSQMQQLQDSMPVHQRAPRSHLSYSKETGASKRSPQGFEGKGMAVHQTQNIAQQLELDPLNKILPPSSLNSPQTVIMLTKELSTLPPTGMVTGVPPAQPPGGGFNSGGSSSYSMANGESNTSNDNNNQQQLSSITATPPPPSTITNEATSTTAASATPTTSGASPSTAPPAEQQQPVQTRANPAQQITAQQQHQQPLQQPLQQQAQYSAAADPAFSALGADPRYGFDLPGLPPPPMPNMMPPQQARHPQHHRPHHPRWGGQQHMPAARQQQQPSHMGPGLDLMPPEASEYQGPPAPLGAGRGGPGGWRGMYNPSLNPKHHPAGPPLLGPHSPPYDPRMSQQQRSPPAQQMMGTPNRDYYEGVPDYYGGMTNEDPAQQEDLGETRYGASQQQISNSGPGGSYAGPQQQRYAPRPGADGLDASGPQGGYQQSPNIEPAPPPPRKQHNIGGTSYPVGGGLATPRRRLNSPNKSSVSRLRPSAGKPLLGVRAGERLRNSLGSRLKATAVGGPPSMPADALQQSLEKQPEPAVDKMEDDASKRAPIQQGGAIEQEKIDTPETADDAAAAEIASSAENSPSADRDALPPSQVGPGQNTVQGQPGFDVVDLTGDGSKRREPTIEGPVLDPNGEQQPGSPQGQSGPSSVPGPGSIEGIDMNQQPPDGLQPALVETEGQQPERDPQQLAEQPHQQPSGHRQQQSGPPQQPSAQPHLQQLPSSTLRPVKPSRLRPGMRGPGMKAAGLLNRRPSAGMLGVAGNNFRTDINRHSRLRANPRLGTPQKVPLGSAALQREWENREKTQSPDMPQQANAPQSNMDKLLKLKSFYPPALSAVSSAGKVGAAATAKQVQKKV